MARSLLRLAGPIGALMAALALAGCAHRQRIPLDLGPGHVQLFVNGEQADEVPRELELRTDRDHKLFVKRPGYVPELVVLEAREIDGRGGLVPAQVHVRLRPQLGDRDITIEEIEQAADDRAGGPEPVD